jgi:hypothetical protein
MQHDQPHCHNHRLGHNVRPNKGWCHEIGNNEDTGQQNHQPHYHNHRLGHNVRPNKGAVSRDLE